MTGSELAGLIRKLRPPFLEGLGTAEMTSVLSAARQRRFLAKSVITNQGHPASHIFMILSGHARSFFLTEGGQKLHMYSIPAGELFGGMALVARASDYVLTTEAIRDSTTLVWDRPSIRSLTTQYPRLLDNALCIASDYLNVSIAAQVAITCHTARQRLAEVLVNLATGIGHRVPDGIELNMRNEDLASAASVTPFTVSRLMSDWHRLGLVVKRRGKVLVPSPERLLLYDL